MINLCLPKQRLKLEKRGIEQNITNYNILCDCFIVLVNIVREPAILLIKWLKPKGLKVCSYIETYAEKNQIFKKNRLVHKNAMRDGIPWGQFLKLALKWGTLYHIIQFDLLCTP